MDISPVPMHKGVYVAQVEVHSPTLDDDEDDEMALDSPAPISRQSCVEGMKAVAE